MMNFFAVSSARWSTGTWARLGQTYAGLCDRLPWDTKRRKWLFWLASLLLSCSPAQAAKQMNAANYTFQGNNVPLGCSGGNGAYTCAKLTLLDGDTIAVSSPVTITVVGAFTAGDSSAINSLGATNYLTFMVGGITIIGDGAHVNANVTGTGVVTLGDKVKFTGNISTANAVINVGDDGILVGNLTTGSGAINVGDRSKIDGSIVASVAGVVTLGAESTVTGNIVTKSGAVNVGAKGHVFSYIASTLAGVVTIGAQAMVGGDITTVSGAINLGVESKVNGSVSDSIAGAITVGAKAAVSGGISTNSGAITLGNEANAGGSVCTGLAGAITVGDNVAIKGNIVTNNGAITVGDKSRVDGTITAVIGAVTVASSAKQGSTGSKLACPNSPVNNKLPPATIKSREWRQIFMR